MPVIANSPCRRCLHRCNKMLHMEEEKESDDGVVVDQKQKQQNAIEVEQKWEHHQHRHHHHNKVRKHGKQHREEQEGKMAPLPPVAAAVCGCLNKLCSSEYCITQLLIPPAAQQQLRCCRRPQCCLKMLVQVLRKNNKDLSSSVEDSDGKEDEQLDNANVKKENAKNLALENVSETVIDDNDDDGQEHQEKKMEMLLRNVVSALQQNIVGGQQYKQFL